MNIEMTVTPQINIDVDYVIYDGTNSKEVFDFVINNYLNGDDPENSFEERPVDIPNFDYSELKEWWLKTTEIKNVDGYTIHTHNNNNIPEWRKDEDFRIVFKSHSPGYVVNEYFTKNTAVVVFGDNHFVLHNANEEKIKKRVMNIVANKLDSICSYWSCVDCDCK